MYQFMIEKVSLWNEYSELAVPKLYKHNNMGWGSLHLITHIVAYIKKQKVLQARFYESQNNLGSSIKFIPYKLNFLLLYTEIQMILRLK